MIVCRIKKVKNPEIKVVPTIIKILYSKSNLIASKSAFSEDKKVSTAVREFPIKRGAKREKIRAITVIKNPKINWVR